MKRNRFGTFTHQQSLSGLSDAVLLRPSRSGEENRPQRGGCFRRNHLQKGWPQFACTLLDRQLLKRTRWSHKFDVWNDLFQKPENYIVSVRVDKGIKKNVPLNVGWDANLFKIIHVWFSPKENNIRRNLQGWPNPHRKDFLLKWQAISEVIF